MASSNLEVIGDVYELNLTDDISGTDTVDAVRFTISLSAGSSPVDFETVQMVWAIEDVVEILTNVSGGDISTDCSAQKWNITDGSAGGDLLLEDQDKFTILARPKSTLTTNEEFNLDIRPSVGAAFGLKRIFPAKINSVNLFY